MPVSQVLKRPLGIGKWLVRSPRPDERGDGPFAVFDRKAEPVGFFKTYDEAAAKLKDELNMGGTIFDISNYANVTPEEKFRKRLAHFFNGKPLVELPDFSGGGGGDDGKQPSPGTPADNGPPMPGRMDAQTEQLAAALAHMGTAAWAASPIKPDLSNVSAYIRTLNAMKNIPVIDYFNRRCPDLTKEVTINVPTPKTKTRKVVVDRDVPETISTHSSHEVNFPTNVSVRRPIRGIEEILDVPPALLAMPPAYWGPQILDHQVLVPAYQDDVVTPQIIVKTQHITERQPYEEVVMVPTKVRVPDEKKGQVLYILADWSPSMYSPTREDCDARRLPLAVAFISVVIGCHLGDGSRYYYRPFTDTTGPKIEAEDQAGKAALIAHLLVPPLLPGGTDIIGAIRAAATEISGYMRNEDDIPEILIVTDGDQAFDTEAVRQALGPDVILHAVCINASNPFLRQCSKTYMELWTSGNSDVRIVR